MVGVVGRGCDFQVQYKIHSTGRTSHEWVTGHRCNQPVAGFAEKIHFKFTTDKNHRNKMNTEWSTGFFVGISGKQTEYLVATEEGIFSCATIRRLPDDEAYDPSCIQRSWVSQQQAALNAAPLHNGLYSLGSMTVEKKGDLLLAPLDSDLCSTLTSTADTLLPSSRVCSLGASALVTISSSASATSGKPLQHGQAQQEPTRIDDESTRETTCSRPEEQLTCAR